MKLETNAVIEAFGTKDLNIIKGYYQRRDINRSKRLGDFITTSILSKSIPEGTWLDYGCGPAPPKFGIPTIHYSGYEPPPDGRFPVVIICQVLHHTQNKEEVISKAVNYLTIDGILAIHEPEKKYAKENIELDYIYYKVLKVEQLELPTEEEFLTLKKQDRIVKRIGLIKEFTSGPIGASKSRLSLYRKVR